MLKTITIIVNSAMNHLDFCRGGSDIHIVISSPGRNGSRGSRVAFLFQNPNSPDTKPDVPNKYYKLGSTTARQYVQVS